MFYIVYIPFLLILKCTTYAAVDQHDIFGNMTNMNLHEEHWAEQLLPPACTETIKCINMTEHLASPFVQQTCANRTVCDFTVDNNEICTSRIHNGRDEQRGFRNWCYLFLSNMCDNPGKEFHIHFPYSCKKVMQYRRKNIKLKNADGEKHRKHTTNIYNSDPLTTSHYTGNVTVPSNDTSKTTNLFNTKKSLKPVQRQGSDKQNMYYTTKMHKYNTDLAWDYHTCQLSCPPAYKPVCLNVNKGLGKKMRFYTFVNHCEMDSYVCSHPNEFNKLFSDDNDADKLQPSALGWTFCSSTRYTQFARFSETVHSMGHFGWLAGDFSPAHILEPWERIPGYGRKK